MLQLHARGEEGEALQQPLHVGVLHLEPAETEPGRDLGELGGELGAHVAHEAQLALVEPQQARIHQPRAPCSP